MRKQLLTTRMHKLGYGRLVEGTGISKTCHKDIKSTAFEKNLLSSRNVARARPPMPRAIMWSWG
jgi:hypothetical protein